MVVVGKMTIDAFSKVWKLPAPRKDLLLCANNSTSGERLFVCHCGGLSMGHRGFVIDEYEPSKYRLWYTHWGALLRYETPDEQKVPLPFGPAQYPQRKKDDHIFLRSMWPTTYTTQSTYQTVYDKEGEDTGVIQEWDSLSKLGVIFDYWEEMHWQIYDEVCPLCKNPNDFIYTTNCVL